MCGIVGAIAKRDVVPILMDGLRRLEYRGYDSAGIAVLAKNGVIERKRAGLGFTDGLLWHCENCNHKLHEVYFELHNIEKDFLPHFEHFYNSESLRTCDNCCTVMETDPRFVAKK